MIDLVEDDDTDNLILVESGKDLTLLTQKPTAYNGKRALKWNRCPKSFQGAQTFMLLAKGRSWVLWPK